MDDELVNVVTFVQPDSEQPCLLGMNALPFLELNVVRRNGEVVEPNPTCPPVEFSRVSLVTSVIIPSRKDVTLRPELTAKTPLPKTFCQWPTSLLDLS